VVNTEQQEFESTRIVHLMYIAGGLVLAYLLARVGEWGWGFFAKPNEAILTAISVGVAAGVGFAAYRHERVYNLASEVAIELQKVDWPKRKETRAATIVTMVTVCVASSILGLMDVFWSWLVKLVYAG